MVMNSGWLTRTLTLMLNLSNQAKYQSSSQMTRTENLSHPSVELKLPLNRDSQTRVIPTETTLFFWGAIAPAFVFS